MAEANIDNAQHAMTYILLTFLPFFGSWFGSLLTTTTIQLYDCQLSNQLHLPLCHFPVKHRKKKLSTRSLLLAKRASRHKVRNVSTPRSLVALRYLLPSAILVYKAGCHIERLFSVFT
jgi:hypothetical protein